MVWKGERQRHSTSRRGIRTTIAKGKSYEPKYWIFYHDENGELIQVPSGSTKEEGLRDLEFEKQRHPDAYLMSNTEITKNIKKEQENYKNHGWSKVPSVMTGGKPYFYTKNTPKGMFWVVWDRNFKQWILKDDNNIYGNYDTYQKAIEFFDNMKIR